MKVSAAISAIFAAALFYALCDVTTDAASLTQLERADSGATYEENVEDGLLPVLRTRRDTHCIRGCKQPFRECMWSSRTHCCSKVYVPCVRACGATWWRCHHRWDGRYHHHRHSAHTRRRRSVYSDVMAL